MKKKLLIITLILFVIILAGILLFVFTEKNKSPTDNKGIEKSLEKRVVLLEDHDEFDDLVVEKDLTLFFSEDKTSASIVDLKFWDFASEMTVLFGDENSIETFNIYIPLCDISVLSSKNSEGEIREQVYEICQKTVNDFAELFDRQYTQNIQLSNNDGTFCELKSADNIESFINEESYINFSVRDENGCYYVMQISLFESVIEVEINKYFDVDKYKEYVANISLYERN